MFGAAKAIGDLAPEDVEVHFIVAACEVRFWNIIPTIMPVLIAYKSQILLNSCEEYD